MKTRSQTKNEKLIANTVVWKPKTQNEKLVAKPVVKKVNPPIERMKTRYQTRNAALVLAEEPEPEVVQNFFVASAQPDPKGLKNFFIPSEPMIDFDDASACWRANKKHLGNGMFKYVCPYMKDDNQRCGRNVANGNMTCRYH
jgi:hypothetical protein